MRLRLSILLFFCILTTWAQTTYYVALTGNNSNNGLSEANAFRTLVYANSRMNDGDILYIKTGNYGNDRPVISKNNVQWIGYATTPGDLDRDEGEGPLWNYPSQSFSNTRMPTITAADQLTQRCVDVTGSNVTIKNLQVTEGTFGFNWTGNGGIADNIVAYEIGDTTGPEGSPSGNQYSIGIRFRGNNSTIKNSIVVNSTGEGITFRGASSSNRSSGSVVSHCKVYSDKTTAQNGCDYFIMFYDHDNGIVDNCHVEQINDTNSGRHGLSIKSSGTGNVFQNSSTAGVNIEANFVAVTGNTWRNIDINGKYLSANAGTGGRIGVNNGAHHNLFENITLRDVRYGISFADWDDGAVGPGNASVEFGTGNDNDFVNIQMYDVGSVIFFSWFQNLSSADNNRIFNLTVHNADRLFEVRTANTGTKLYNVVLDDVDAFIGASTESLNSNTVFSYVNLQNSFAASALTPYQENNITTIPFAFVNEGTNNYRISTNALDVGQTLSGIFARAAFDYDGNSRVAPYTLGAFEFGGAPPVGDVDEPTIASQSVISVTETTFRLDWTLNEPSKGRVRYGTTSGVYTDSTNTENNFLLRHIQTVGGNNAPLLSPGTTYHYQYYMEDATGNSGYSAEYTQTTLGEGEPEAPSPVTVENKRGLLLKTKKL